MDPRAVVGGPPREGAVAQRRGAGAGGRVALEDGAGLRRGGGRLAAAAVEQHDDERDEQQDDDGEDGRQDPTCTENQRSRGHQGQAGKVRVLVVKDHHIRVIVQM